MKNMAVVYCISGLGADERIFQKLQLPGVKCQPLPWITPQSGEPITDYAKRMSAQITTQNPVLMGVSFGGMMALEISRHIPTAKIIIISSIKSGEELPGWMRLCGLLKLNRLVPERPWKWLRPIENKVLGAIGPEEKKMANDFREQIDPAYLQWAICEILNWRNEFQPTSLYHIHGNKDKTFPIRKIRATHIIEGGGHFMVMNKAGEISGILQKILMS
jgi:pimeloyl-ACP methyl ester carboxylesterase